MDFSPSASLAPPSAVAFLADAGLLGLSSPSIPTIQSPRASLPHHSDHRSSVTMAPNQCWFEQYRDSISTPVQRLGAPAHLWFVHPGHESRGPFIQHLPEPPQKTTSRACLRFQALTCHRQTRTHTLLCSHQLFATSDDARRCLQELQRLKPILEGRRCKA
jgi:hypothetical protein